MTQKTTKKKGGNRQEAMAIQKLDDLARNDDLARKVIAYVEAHDHDEHGVGHDDDDEGLDCVEEAGVGDGGQAAEDRHDAAVARQHLAVICYALVFLGHLRKGTQASAAPDRGRLAGALAWWLRGAPWTRRAP